MGDPQGPARRGSQEEIVRALGKSGLVLASALLFSASFPNFVIKEGIGIAAFFCLVPMFFIISRSSIPGSAMYGALFGVLAYGISDYWLYSFDPLAPLVVLGITAVYFALLFPLLSLVNRAFPKAGWIFQTGLWVGYEYLRTLGFLGYPYGILGYSQYLNLPLLRSASLFGVFGVSALIVLPQALAARALRSGPSAWRTGARRILLPGIFWAAAMAALVIWGSMGEPARTSVGTLKIALVQPNRNPRQGGTRVYAEGLAALERLSASALKEGVDLVVWPETAFVPSIEWHERYRSDRELYDLVKNCLDFVASSGVPFLIGNDHGELGRDEAGRERRLDFNSAILLEPGGRRELYRKGKLVPLLESFPFPRLFPRIYRFLEAYSGFFWTPGTERKVFGLGKLSFASPICFEEGFGSLVGDFVEGGADFLIPLVNDAWSKSAACEYQHAACAAFRAAEFGMPVLRCTNSGLTCVVSPRGSIERRLPQFEEGVLIAKVEVPAPLRTLYRTTGDAFAIACLALGALGTIAGAALGLRKRLRLTNP
jgi:apolipoprotein N-acyltransferase